MHDILKTEEANYYGTNYIGFWWNVLPIHKYTIRDGDLREVLRKQIKPE